MESFNDAPMSPGRFNAILEFGFINHIICIPIQLGQFFRRRAQRTKSETAFVASQDSTV
jgi:hypothetical protein